MKCNDYAVRTGYMESFLTGSQLQGVEVGVAYGSHAHSLLLYCDIEKLWLIDPWENKYAEGYCAGRLAQWRNKICMEKSTSQQVVKNFGVRTLDFVYLDREHTYEAGHHDLFQWWPTLKEGGILALRNYNGNADLKRAADEFTIGKRCEVENYVNELLIFK